MKTARELHNQAMAVSAQADRSKRRGDLKEAQKLFQKAMQLGIGAAEQLDPVGSKLSWSIMMRSAASLAFLAGQMRTAERLACSALAGEPHPEVIHELRDVLKAIYLQPDDPEETHGVLSALRDAIDHAVAAKTASPITYSNTYDDVDYRPGRPGFIVGIGEEEETEGYEVMVRRTYGRGRRVEDAVPGE